MKKLFLLGVMALLCLISSKARSQDFENNLDKYRKFRDRLRQDFVRIGSEQGQSIPAGARSIGFAFGFLNPNVSSVYLIEPVEMGNSQPVQNLWILFHVSDKGKQSDSGTLGQTPIK